MIPIVNNYETFSKTEKVSKPAEKDSKPIILERGNKISCPIGQLLINGNCLACK